MRGLYWLIIICVLCACSNAENAKNPGLQDDSGLVVNIADTVVYYPFNGNAEDQVGDLHGLINGAVLSRDRFGHASAAMSFDGVDDDVRVPGNSLLDVTGPFSLVAWIHPVEQKTQFIMVMGADVNGQNAAPYGLSLSATGDIIFSLRPGGTLVQLRSPGYELNGWTLVVGTFDGTIMSLYVDGSLQDSVEVQGDLAQTGNELIIGTRLNIVSSTFSGRLDEIRIVDRVLSQNEIDFLYTN